MVTTPLPGIQFPSLSISSSPLSTLPGPTSVPTHTSISVGETSLQPIPTQPEAVPGGFTRLSTSDPSMADPTTPSLDLPSADSGSDPTTVSGSHLALPVSTNSSITTVVLNNTETVPHAISLGPAPALTSTFADATSHLISPAPVASSDPAPSTTKSHPNQGIIIDLVVGMAIVGVCFVLALCWYIADRRQRAARSAPEGPPRGQCSSLRSASVIQVVETDVGALPRGTARRGSNNTSSKSCRIPPALDVNQDRDSGRGELGLAEHARSERDSEDPGTGSQAVVQVQWFGGRGSRSSSLRAASML